MEKELVCPCPAHNKGKILASEPTPPRHAPPHRVAERTPRPNDLLGLGLGHGGVAVFEEGEQPGSGPIYFSPRTLWKELKK